MTLIPVHDLDAEASVLSTLMLDPERLASIERNLTPDDFYADANRQIARVLWDLDEAGEAIDITAVAGALRAAGRLEQVGGTLYLAQIQDATPSVAHVEAHARTVSAAARIRRVQAVCQTIVAEGYAALGDAAEWLQSVEARIFAATDAASMKADTISVVADTAPEELEALVERSKRKALPGRRTRLNGLDRILGGMVDAVPYVLAGRPGHGKTACAWQLSEGIALDGALVAFLSQEMPRPQLVQRAIAQAANVEVEGIRYGRLSTDDWNSVATAVGFVSALPIAIDDRAGHSIHSARSSVRRCVQKLRAKGHTGPLGLIVLDYLQIMGGDRARGDSRSTEVADNMHGMTKLAKEFRCPVLILSQLNREIEKRPEKRPKLSDLGESGAIEADGYAVMFVYREDCYRDPKDHDGLAEIIVAKNRNGRTGTASMRYMPSTLFAGVAEDEEWARDFTDPTATRES